MHLYYAFLRLSICKMWLHRFYFILNGQKRAYKHLSTMSWHSELLLSLRLERLSKMRVYCIPKGKVYIAVHGRIGRRSLPENNEPLRKKLFSKLLSCVIYY